MRVIHLIIKGTVADAATALVAHGIHPSDQVTPIAALDPTPETSVSVCVRAENDPGIIRWFAEPPSEAPYPPGTLLYWRRINHLEAIS